MVKVFRGGGSEPEDVAVDEVIAAARRLWTEHPFADVSVEDVATAARTTPAQVLAAYPTMPDLFAAVYRSVGDEVSTKALAALSADRPQDLLREGAEVFLTLFSDPATRRIMLSEAPAALGWERWRELGAQYGTLTIEIGLLDAMDKGAIPEQPVKPLGMIVAGILESATMYVASQDDRELATREAMAVLEQVLDGLTRPR